jgi:hypothetical protein
MTDDSRWKEINKQGSGTPPTGTGDTQPDAQTALDRANNASDLHQAANRAADRSKK